MTAAPDDEALRLREAIQKVLWVLEAIPEAAPECAALRDALGGPTCAIVHGHVAGREGDIDRCHECGHNFRSACHERSIR